MSDVHVEGKFPENHVQFMLRKKCLRTPRQRQCEHVSISRTSCETSAMLITDAVAEQVTICRIFTRIMFV